MPRAPFRSLAVAALSSLLLACPDDSSGPPPVTETPVARISVSPTSFSLGVGATQALTATTRAADNTVLSGRDVTWSSSDPAATVTSAGLVTAVAPGSSVITAKSGDAIGIVMVSVTVAVSTVTVEPSTSTLLPGTTSQLATSIRDGAGGILANRVVSWSSSNTGVATVDAATGVVTAVAAGSTTITASSEGKTGTSTVTVVSALTQGSVASVTSGSSCGLTKTGTVYCWGGSSSLGRDPALGSSYAPVLVAGLSNIVSIAGGERHTYALTSDGKIWVWGDAGAGGPTTWYTPHLLSSTPAFKSISAESYQLAALTADGTPYIWDGSSATLTPVSTTLKFTKFVAGYEHFIALTSAGAAYAWGGNSSGQIGDNTKTNRTAPTAVSGGIVFKDIAAGPTTSYGLDQNGIAWSWGSVSNYLAAGPNVSQRLVPGQVSGGRAYAALYGNHWRTFALTADGTAYVWGTGMISPNGIAFNSGATGTGGSSSTNSNLDVPTLVLGGLKFSQIAAGYEHSYGLTTDGTAYGWGTSPQSGVSTSNYSPATQPPSFALQLPTSTVTVEAGKSTSLAVKLVSLPGAFTTNGPKPFTGNVTLSGLANGGGLSFAFSPATLGGAATTSSVTITTSSSTGTFSFGVQGTPSGSSTASSGIGGSITVQTPAVAGQMDLVCPTGSTVLPSGFHCMTNSAGQHVPGKYSYAPMQGSWVDTEAGVCLTWGADGKMSGKYKGGSFGASGTMAQGEWGVIVKRSGTPEGTATQWYVFSETADDQLKLLSYDSAANKIIGWHFTKQSSCPNW